MKALLLKVAEALRFLGKLLRRIDKFKSVTRYLHHLARTTARLLEKAADGGIAKAIAKKAFTAFKAAIDKVPKKIQKKLTKYIYYVVFDCYL